MSEMTTARDAAWAWLLRTGSHEMPSTGSGRRRESIEAARDHILECGVADRCRWPELKIEQSGGGSVALRVSGVVSCRCEIGSHESGVWSREVKELKDFYELEEA